MTLMQKIFNLFVILFLLGNFLIISKTAKAEFEYVKVKLCIPSSDIYQKSCHFTSLDKCSEVRTNLQPYIYPCVKKSLTLPDKRSADFCGSKQDTYNCYAQRTEKDCDSKKGFCEFASIESLTASVTGISGTTMPPTTQPGTTMPPTTQSSAIKSASPSYVPLDNPLKDIKTPQMLIGKIINAAMGLIGSIALLMFVYGGFTWMASAGNPEKIKKGKDILVWAAIGLVIIFSSYALVNLIITSIK